MWLWQPKKKTPTTQSNLVKPIVQLWKIWNSDWLMTLAIHHCNVLLLSDEWVNFSREQAFFSSLLFLRNMSPKPVIVCLEAHFPVTDQPMFPCFEQHCVSWLLCFPDDCVFFQHGRWTECFALWSVFESKHRLAFLWLARWLAWLLQHDSWCRSRSATDKTNDWPKANWRMHLHQASWTKVSLKDIYIRCMVGNSYICSYK